MFGGSDDDITSLFNDMTGGTSGASTITDSLFDDDDEDSDFSGFGIADDDDVGYTDGESLLQGEFDDDKE